MHSCGPHHGRPCTCQPSFPMGPSINGSEYRLVATLEHHRLSLCCSQFSSQGSLSFCLQPHGLHCTALLCTATAHSCLVPCSCHHVAQDTQHPFPCFLWFEYSGEAQFLERSLVLTHCVVFVGGRPREPHVTVTMSAVFWQFDSALRKTRSPSVQILNWFLLPGSWG